MELFGGLHATRIAFLAVFIIKTVNFLRDEICQELSQINTPFMPNIAINAVIDAEKMI